MANPEHVACVRQGAAAIETWREAHPFESLDLRGAILAGADLRGADLRGAILAEAILWGADLREARLQEARLAGARLWGAILQGAILREADLQRAQLQKAYLAGAHLEKAHLREAELQGADLWGAILWRANLTGAALDLATLTRAVLDGAILTDACLWETLRAGWSIHGLVCEAVYWDKDRKERTIYAPGEFQRLYADNTKIILRYEGGINPIEIATLPALIQQMEARYPGCVLRLRSIEDGPGGATVTLMVDDRGEVKPSKLEAMKAELEEKGQALIIAQRAALEAQNQREKAEYALRYLSHEVFPSLVRSVQPKYRAVKKLEITVPAAVTPKHMERLGTDCQFR